jgi:hypothetical protein
MNRIANTIIILTLFLIISTLAAAQEAEEISPPDTLDRDFQRITADTIPTTNLPMEDWLKSDFLLSSHFVSTDTIIFTEADMLKSSAFTLGQFFAENSMFYLFDYGKTVQKEILHYQNNPVKIIVDGREWINPQFNTENLKMISLHQIKKIAIVRNYTDRNPIAIHIWTKKQITSSVPYTSVTGSEGTKGKQQYSVVFATPIRKNLTTVITAFYNKNDGESENNEYSSTVYSLHLHYQLTDKFSAHFAHHLAEQTGIFFPDNRRMDYELSSQYIFSEKLRTKFRLYNSRLKQYQKDLIYGAQFDAVYTPFHGDLVRIKAVGEQFSNETQDHKTQLVDLTLSNDYHKNRLSFLTSLTTSYHYDYDKIYVSPRVRLGYALSPASELAFAAGKNVNYPELNGGVDDRSPEEIWQTDISASYKPLSLIYTYKTDDDTVEIHQISGLGTYDYRDFSAGLNVTTTFAENPNTGHRLPYQPRYSLTGNLDWHRNFFHDNMEVRAGLEGKFTSWVYTDSVEDNFIDDNFLLNSLLKVKIYDFSISYAVRNVTWSDYSRVEGYPLWRKIYQIRIRWEFWN